MPKKSGRKPTGDEKEKEKFSPKEPGTEYARITKLMGNSHVMVFSNDGKERLCRIAGRCRYRGRFKFYVNDIVLISLREFEKTEEDYKSEGQKEKKENADIIYKYSSQQERQLAKQPGIHKNLFARTDASSSTIGGGNGTGESHVHDDGFEWDHSDDEESRSEDEAGGKGGGEDDEDSAESGKEENPVTIMNKVAKKDKVKHGMIRGKVVQKPSEEKKFAYDEGCDSGGSDIDIDKI